MLPCIIPGLQLAVKKTLQRAVVAVVFTVVHVLACKHLHCAQTVLIQVVRVCLLNAQRSVAVSTPTAAAVELIVDAADAILAAEHQSESIILTIAGVGEMDLAEQRCEEGAGSAETVDAERVVGTVLVCPLFVVDETRRKGVEVEVADAVAAHNHGCLLLVERCNDGCEGVL